jgi:hypothetical protein
MASISIFAGEYEGTTIRVTEDGRFSVFDVLVAFGVCDKLSNAKNVLKRLSDNHSEVTTICSNFKFPGRGQRETPVATEEGLYQVLMLCPGKRGAEFRKWAAGILSDPAKAIDHAVQVGRSKGWSDKRIKARVDGKLARYKLTDTLKEHGISQPKDYAQCTEAINVGLFGQTAKELKASRQVKLTRDGLDEIELAALALAELKSGRTIEEANAWGVDQCEGICADTANKVKAILE